MIQEAKERRLPVKNSNTIIFNLDDFAEAVDKDPNLLSTQKEAIINLVLELEQEQSSEKEILEKKLTAYEQFKDEIDDFHSKKVEGPAVYYDLIGHLFRDLLNIDIEQLGPTEKWKIQDILNQYAKTDPIEEALTKIDDKLEVIQKETEGEGEEDYSLR